MGVFNKDCASSLCFIVILCPSRLQNSCLTPPQMRPHFCDEEKLWQVCQSRVLWFENYTLHKKPVLKNNMRSAKSIQMEHFSVRKCLIYSSLCPFPSPVHWVRKEFELGAHVRKGQNTRHAHRAELARNHTLGIS